MIDRRRLIAMIHCAKRDLGLDDDTYRAVLVRVGKVDSCTTMSDANLVRVVEEFRKQGFQPRTGVASGKLSQKATVRKIWALWGELRRLGELRSSDGVALRHYTKNLTGVDNPEWLNAGQTNKVIENLKQWVERVKKEQANGRRAR